MTRTERLPSLRSCSVIALCLCLIALWLLSGWCAATYGDGQTYQIRTIGGGLEVSWGAPLPFPVRHCDFYDGFSCSMRPSYALLPLPYADHLATWHVVGVPAWPVALVAFAILIREYRRWRRSAGSGTRCPCGYDLTGNVSGRCPECGTALNSGEGARDRQAG